MEKYLRDRYASMVRPERELQGFLRVALFPGEAKKITFTAAPSQMAFLTKDMRWKVEKGRFDVLSGIHYFFPPAVYSAGDCPVTLRKTAEK